MKPAPIPQDYTTFLAHLKQRVIAARVHAARAVNYDLVLLYWDIGQGIVEKQKNAAWGDSVVERLAKDLRTAFPGMTGFSADNVWRMRQFYSDCSSETFLAQAARVLKLPNLLEQPVPEREETTSGTILEQAVPERLSQAVRDLASIVPWGLMSS